MLAHKLRAWLMVMLLLLGAVSPAALQDVPDDPDTARALETIVPPPRDRVALAVQFGQAQATPTPTPPATPFDVGAIQAFWYNDGAQPQQTDAILLARGEHVYIWVAAGQSVMMSAAQGLADTFDTQIYQQARALWGVENLSVADADGDPRVHVLFVPTLGANFAGYFYSEYQLPTLLFPNSNQREMLFFNLAVIGPNINTPTVHSIVAHEFQHLLRYQQNPRERAWVDEGYSMYTEAMLGFQPVAFAGEFFLQRPSTQLNAWTKIDWPQYGASLLWVAWLAQRHSDDTLRQISLSPRNGWGAVVDVLGEASAAQTFAEWTLINARAHPDYESYTLFPDLPLPPAAQPTAARLLPYSETSDTPPYSANYTRVRVDGQAQVDFALTTPTHIPLLPFAADGTAPARYWYSNQGERIASTLTHNIDLRGLTSATLQYRAWWLTEANYDYGYVSISTDSGSTWAALRAADMTDTNPHGLAYGAGYTGASDGWRDQQIDLSAYVGAQVLLRFWYITDDSMSQDGWAVADVCVVELGCMADAPLSDTATWAADGWLPTDNRLRLGGWVQVVALQDDGPRLLGRWWLGDGIMDDATIADAMTLPRDADGVVRWSLPNDGKAAEWLIVFAPLAPATQVAVPYTLQIGTP
jgi:immune inhibitor A